MDPESKSYSILFQTGSCYERNIEGRSSNPSCSGNAISITYNECVFVVLGIQNAKGKRNICHLWPAWVYNIFTHFLTNNMIFEKRY